MKNLTFLIITVILTQVTSCNKPTRVEKIESCSLGLDTFKVWSIFTTELQCKGIPDSVFKMVNLKILRIQGEDCDLKYDEKGNDLHPECCFLSEISPKIKDLKELRELYLPLSGFATFPNEIADCQNLILIDLTDGTIQNIDVLTKLKKLKKLYLFGCQITKLPKNINELNELKELGLTGNQIDKVELERVKKALPNCDVIFETPNN
jgi:Leucine-rich repeat (LRR) protein